MEVTRVRPPINREILIMITMGGYESLVMRAGVPLLYMPFTLGPMTELRTSTVLSPIQGGLMVICPPSKNLYVLKKYAFS